MATDPSATGRPREPLERRRILEAALRLIDEHGMAELSMRRLGAELGVQAMSLYRHVENKQAVVEGVRELIYEELAALRPTGPPPARWEDALVALARDFRRTFQRHPHALGLFATDLDRAYAACARILEPPLRALADAGFDPDAAAAALRVVVRYVLASELLSATVTSLSPPLAPAEVDAVAAEHPLVGHLVRHVRAREPEGMVEPGLDLIIAGLRVSGLTGPPGG
ncbi:TetR/AcrR family transcriptional regulator [Miltoncostaea marina]|uniref:TetR/AcrR family transcriptional regulator n=1 Tax=Miltoncostaea marina TaxID=2843215 RepID=UPI001C3E43BE|nr:TetR/AcrR family transcriptional regulator C-terminal domain-containing protein [Miltoncostaea marina]